ncbi:AGE family epimerase/isomerase [Pedobacter sp. AW31-3R]|uniref:AGE family epimerase/isomerase n=1 Tax=Pedobacter sp. AW31-3R TaxID=3445781 RepID=UPI003F9F6930
MRADLLKYREELGSELENILQYWKNYTVDPVNGGFVGRVDNDNHIDFSAAKGSVLNARILWSFSAAFNHHPNADYLDLAHRAFDYIIRYFLDEQYGGVYWLLDVKGNPLDSKKQVYAIAFTIYAFSEYHLASDNELAKEKAIELYGCLIDHSFDSRNSGYFEAFSREWETLADLRLSDKDANEKKTMNTHLHVLEAFTTLYKIWPHEQLKERIKGLIHDFTAHIIAEETGNLILFFDENWKAKSDMISYGHDIEASWLLLEAAEVISDERLLGQMKSLAVKMATRSLEGLDADGSLRYEYSPSTDHVVKEKHWWVQAEAMVGFFNAWELSGKESFLNTSLENWAFIKKNILNKEHGEWFWGLTESGAIMSAEDKVGIWKCPYHNSRACIEVIKRISSIERGAG